MMLEGKPSRADSVEKNRGLGNANRLLLMQMNTIDITEIRRPIVQQGKKCRVTGM
jgi:hypothetical protein